MKEVLSSLDLLAHLTDAVIAVDLESRVFFWNAGAQKLYGWSSEEAIGQSADALFETRFAAPANSTPGLESVLDSLLRDGSWQGELTRSTRLGEPVDVLSRWAVLRDQTGNSIGRLIIDTDLTETRLRFHESRLAESRARECAENASRHEALLAALIDGISDYAFMKDCDSRYIAVNPATAAFFGRPVAEVIGKNDYDLFPPDIAERLIEEDRAVLASGGSLSFEQQLPGAAGITSVHTIKTVCRDAAGQVIGLVGISRDRRFEQQLALSETRYRSLVHASSQIVWITNTEGQQTGSPLEWQAFTGQSSAEVQGFGWADAIHPDDRSEAMKLWLEAARNGTVLDLTHRLRRHDGVYRRMAVRAVPVRDDNGNIVEWIGTHTDITEQTEAQEEARRANQQLRNVLDSITDGICVLDRDWNYIYFNENGARMFGLTSGGLLGKKFGEVFSQVQTHAFAEAYGRAIETGAPIHFEEFYGDPSNKWIECHGYPSTDGLTIYFRDITERKRTEQALRTSESRYRKLFESDMMGIGTPDRFGGFREANNELLRITGYTREDLEAGLVRWDRMTPPEYAQIDAAHIAEAARRGSCTPYEKEYIRKDGSRVPILCGYALLEGSVNEYIGFVLDISRQREAEAGLREREERFRLLAEGIPQLVWLTDAAGTITYLNQRFMDYVGIPPAQAYGFHWPDILHPEEHDQVMRQWTRSVESGEPYVEELRMRRADGVFRHFLAHAVAMRNQAGEVERWVGSCTDIHDQKLSEEALRRSEKLAATGRLAASIAHEINNPLEAVTNTLYLALHDPELNPQTRSFLQMAEQELARVAHITTQTLRFHRQSKSPAEADLSVIMESVFSLFGPRLYARQIEVERQLQTEATIFCLADELRQVFANIVSNSLDASSDGGRICIRVRRASAATADRTPGVRVTVADTGCGIPKELQKSIFEPFFSTKDATGLGLGLWVSSGIIRKHQGRIRVRSSAESAKHGTVMSIFFPASGLDV